MLCASEGEFICSWLHQLVGFMIQSIASFALTDGLLIGILATTFNGRIAIGISMSFY